MAEPLELVAIGCSHYEKGGRTCDFCYAHFKTPPFTGAHKPDCPVHLATGKLPCNHPASCANGGECGWCAAVEAARKCQRCGQELRCPPCDVRAACEEMTKQEPKP